MLIKRLFDIIFSLMGMVLALPIFVILTIVIKRFSPGGQAIGNGRNNMDLEYIDNWSIGLDFKVLLKTIPAVLFSIGAR